MPYGQLVARERFGFGLQALVSTYCKTLYARHFYSRCPPNVSGLRLSYNEGRSKDRETITRQDRILFFPPHQTRYTNGEIPWARSFP